MSDDRELVFRIGVGVYTLTGAALLSSLGLWLRALLRGSALPPPRQDVSLGLGLLALALLARLSHGPELSNWYALVLAPEGQDIWARFGPGQQVLHAGLRTLGLYGERTPFLLNQLLGSVTPLLLFVALRARGLSALLATCAAAGFALTPLCVRIACSPAAHVTAFTAVLGALLAWDQALRNGKLLGFVLGALLGACAVLARADAWVSLGVVPLWLLVPDRPCQRAVAGTRHPRAQLVRLWSISSWIIVGALGWYLIVKPSNHPAPEHADRMQALGAVWDQFVRLGLGRPPPAWLHPVTLLLAPLGLSALAWRRWGFALVSLLALLGTHFGLGRSLFPDGLVGARYLQLPLAIWFVWCGAGVEQLTRWARELLSKRVLWARAELVPALGFGLCLAWPREAQSLRYTFQDEYDFLRAELAQLPAGCRVYQVPVRSTEFGGDLDCCLDAGNSPLVLAYPELVFDELPLSRPETVYARERCVALYVSSACSLSVGADVAQRGRARELLNERCAQPFVSGRLEVLAERRVSPHSTQPLLEPEVVVKLTRWRSD